MPESPRREFWEVSLRICLQIAHGALRPFGNNSSPTCGKRNRNPVRQAKIVGFHGSNSGWALSLSGGPSGNQQGVPKATHTHRPNTSCRNSSKPLSENPMFGCLDLFNGTFGCSAPLFLLAWWVTPLKRINPNKGFTPKVLNGRGQNKGTQNKSAFLLVSL